MKKVFLLLMFGVGSLLATIAQADQQSREANTAAKATMLQAIPPAQQLLMLRYALEAAETPAQKQHVLRQISGTGTFLGLLTAGKYLDDMDNGVQQAAVQTVQTIALANPGYYGPEITALLNKVMVINKDSLADTQKQAILKHLAALPKTGGFVAMLNGKDITGWKANTPDGRNTMTPEQIDEYLKKTNEIVQRDWRIINGMLVYMGKGYENLSTVQEYGDFEMYIDWRIEPTADSGIYLRDMPQVQIWDTANRNASVGSGGLYNNQTHPKDPLVCADNPPEVWNSFYIKMIGDKVTVYLNGQLIVDNVTQENLWDRNASAPAKGVIVLQAHATRVDFRDMYIREF